MSANRRRRLDNTVPVGAFSPWLVVAVIAILGGLTRVYYKNQIIHRGDGITKMERELDTLNRKNDALKNRVAQLTTYSALQKCFNDGTIKMVKIAPASIVHVNFPAANHGGNSDIRAVVNEGGTRP
jgi:hypothetical protein